ncbi:hypothetical protein NQ317_010524 [Molorchus minor]|uniref:Glucuronosyltransferase n=1 Tax=Molorchus minor TaxID=1323400 RepID=A0ABQ9IST2_9CUCU|nr:hypothetical protein NQ317_010524 [Molorchus minor]
MENAVSLTDAIICNPSVHMLLFFSLSLLGHKNIKLFITQGGIQSMEEAVINHVPMIGLPFFGDQHHNVNKMVGKGFGISLDYTKLDVVSFKNTILEVISNPKEIPNVASKLMPLKKGVIERGCHSETLSRSVFKLGIGWQSMLINRLY